MDTQNYIDRLSSAMYGEGYTEDEVNECCAYARHLLNQDLPVLFDGNHVHAVLKLDNVGFQMYHTFSIHQVGKYRAITAPSAVLKSRQNWILRNILAGAEVSPQAHGFIAARSIKTNAQVHADHDYVMCLDIRNFFPSITKGMVREVFSGMGYSSRASAKLAEICCYQDCLPQGAPTSPCLSNIIFRPVDEKLSLIALRENISYTRYADDMTFSADHPIGDLLSEIQIAIMNAGFQLNREKIHLYGPVEPKHITGLTVQNGTVHVPKRFKRQLRQEIYYCAKFGVWTHLENTRAKQYVNYREHLYGKAYFVHMIEPELGDKFLDMLDNIPWP